MLRVATDIGGTFTDLVYVTPDGAVGTAKSHSTPGQFEKGVMDVIEASNITPNEFTSFVHGTTIVINAITERKGAKVALLTTEGFRDVLEIGRGNFHRMYDVLYQRPPSLVPRSLRLEATERLAAGGPLSLLFGGMVVARTLEPTGIFEQIGIRFLADHLAGDRYFKVHRPGQSADRAPPPTARSSVISSPACSAT